MTRHLTPFVVLLLLTLAACGSSDSANSDSTTAAEAPAATVTTASTTTATTSATTTTSPPATTTTTEAVVWPGKRGYHEFVYDAGSDVVLAIGGLGVFDVPVSELWSLEPNTMTWTELAGLPGGLDPAGMPVAYDAESDRVVYLQSAAFDLENDLVSTWAYDTDEATWTEMTPDPHPRLGFGARMVYDSESDRLIVYGGNAFSDDRLVATPGTWAYDYNTNSWEELDPATEPGGANYHGMAYDSESDRVILFGLNDFEDISLLWAFDYNTATWQELPLTTGPEGGSVYTQAAYDPVGDRMLVLGGQRTVEREIKGGTLTEMVAHDELWLYDYNTNTWEPGTPLPNPLIVHDMDFVESSGMLVVFGGGSSDDEGMGNAVWVYDPAAETWTSRGP